MKQEEIQSLFKSYEEAACMIDETECWSARDLQKLFGYSLWQNFCNVIDRAKEACMNVGQPLSDHFIDVNKKVELHPYHQCSPSAIRLQPSAIFYHE